MIGRWLPPALVFGLIALLGYGLLQPAHDPVSVLVGKPAPQFSLKDTEGKEHDLARVGRPVVVNFWASWCQPCHAEAAALVETARQHPDVQFFGILYNDATGKHKDYIRRYGVNYPTLFDPSSRTAIAYGVGQIPDTFVIDAAGKIIFHYLGAVTDSPQARDNFEKALREVEASAGSVSRVASGVASESSSPLTSTPASTPIQLSLEDERRVQQIGMKIHCPICSGESIAQSQTDIARDMLSQVRQMVAAGQNEREILEFFKGRYGERILLEPPKTGLTGLLWALPLVVLLLGAAGWWSRVRNTGVRVLSAEEEARIQALISDEAAKRGDDTQ